MDLVTNGKMTKKLINKTQYFYIVFLIVTFIIVAPVFYITTQQLYLNDADESLILQKDNFIRNSLPKLNASSIKIWNNYNEVVKIEKYGGEQSDTLFYSSQINNREVEEEPYRELNTPIVIDGKTYTLSIKISLLESEDLILSIAIFFICLVFLLFIGLYFFTKKMSLNLWKPFYDTLRQIEKFEIDKSEFPNLPESKISEFNSLNASINKLINRNLLIFNSQREFVENAAHELQTPIAIFKAKLDNLIQHPDISKQQSEILISINSTVARLSRLNKNLLLLSRIDNNKTYEVTQFSLVNILKQYLEFFEEQSNKNNIEINFDFAHDITVEANVELTEILINNLLMNAVVHNKVNGQVYVSIYENCLEVSNTGSINTELNNNVFNRFVKSSNSKTGNGLGLSIVKKIAKYYSWQITYKFESNLHKFIVEF